MKESYWISVGGYGPKKRDPNVLKLNHFDNELSPFELRMCFYHCAQGYDQLVNVLITD